MPADVLRAEENLWPGMTGGVLEIYWLARNRAGCLDVFANSYWSGLWPLILCCEASLFFYPPSGDKIKETAQEDWYQEIFPLFPELIEGFAMTQMNIDS